MSIEGIPEGWELVKFDYANDGDWYMTGGGVVTNHLSQKPSQAKRLIIRKIQKPKQYRPFANAAEFAPYRDRWIKHFDVGGAWKVYQYTDNDFMIREGVFCTYKQAFEDGRQFDDGTPFGVEVTE